MPDAAPQEIERACYLLREQRLLGRNGDDMASSPYRFYVKRGHAVDSI